MSDTKPIAKELADIIICVDRVAECFDIDLYEATVDKFNETSKKHGFNTLMGEPE